MNDNIFYVYEWYNKDTGEVFYVGKGNRDRYKKIEGRNQYFQRYYSKHNCDVRKIKINMSEEDAYALEIETISKHKNNNQCVCNFHVGGLGGVTNKNLPYDTYVLKTVSSYINRSNKLLGNESKETYFRLSDAEERALTFAFQECGINTSEDYYELDRDLKLKVANRVMENIEEEDYNNEIRSLIKEGGYFGFDDYWEHNN